MIPEYSNSLKITDLSELVRIRLPLEVMNVERNQDDNEQVLNYVNAFMDVVDEELRIPKLYRDYTLGNKESFVRSKMMPRLELVASRIMEKRAMNCSTESLDESSFFQEELNFFADLYFLLVTSLIDLAAIRKQDIGDGDPYKELIEAVVEHMEYIGAYDELTPLMEELEERLDDYPDKPELNLAINKIIAHQPSREDDFIFYPSKAIGDYSQGDVLVAIDQDSNIQSIEMGELPNGVDIDDHSGDLFVKDPTALVAGVYDVLLETVDEMQGVTTHHLEVPIGGAEIPKYEVAPYRVIGDYLAGDVLARPIITDDVIPIVEAEWETEDVELPVGVALDPATGNVVVSDESQIQIGVYLVSVILITENGSKSRHEFTLSFKQDTKAVYSFKSAKRLKDYKFGDVIASVSDIDGKIINAGESELPSGLKIDSDGQVVVNTPDDLKAGTYLFNVLAKNASNVKSIKTLYVTLEPNQNPFYYDLEGLSPIDDLNIGDVIASLKSIKQGVTPQKVLLSKGVLAPGTSLSANGDIVVADPAKLIAANYDIRFKVYVEGIDSNAIPNAVGELNNKKSELVTKEADLQQSLAELNLASKMLNNFIAQNQHKVINLQNEIAVLEEKILNASQQELPALQQALQEKQAELAQLVIDSDAEYSVKLDAVTEKETAYTALQAEISTLQTEIETLERTLTQLRSERWTEYEVPLLLTLEEDNPSAWHLSIPKDWDEYRDNEVIAQIIDCDGHDTVNFENGGSLPDGLKLDEKKGTIFVDNRHDLSPGEYVLDTKSTDQNNGITEHRLAIIIEGQLSSKDEDFVYLPAKAVGNYVNDEIIGYPFSPLYAITGGRIVKGILPNGVQVDESTGALVVQDASLLRAGYYNGIGLKTSNVSGSVFYHDIRMKFGEQTKFDVIVKPGKPLSDYKKGEGIIGVQLNGGNLQGIQVVGGELASGLQVSSADGLIRVEISKALVEGDYQLELYMLDTEGASDTQTVDYSIGTGRVDPDPKVTWSNNTPVSIDEAVARKLLAEPSVENDEIVKAESSNLPAGIGLNENNGKVTVKSQKRLKAGSHEISIKLLDGAGNKYNEQITLEITPKSAPTGSLETEDLLPVDFHILKNGDILSRLKMEGNVLNATLLSGEIPKGADVDSKNARIVVTDRMELERTPKSGRLLVSIGGDSTLTNTAALARSVTYSLAGLASPAPGAYEVDFSIAVNPIPDFSQQQQNAPFILGMLTRLNDFKLDRFQNQQVANALGNYMNTSESFAQYISTHLGNAKLRINLLAGGRDTYHRKQYDAMTTPIVDNIMKAQDPVIMEALMDLYNELFTSYLAISVFREEDISARKDNPIAAMYSKMDSQIETMSTKADVMCLRENASMIFDRVSAELNRLRIRLAILRS